MVTSSELNRDPEYLLGNEFPYNAHRISHYSANEMQKNRFFARFAMNEDEMCNSGTNDGDILRNNAKK
jgi:hypothetical protein